MPKKQKKRWKPEGSEFYWSMTGDCKIEREQWNECNPYCHFWWKILGGFKTKKEAVAFHKKLAVFVSEEIGIL